MHCKSGNCYPMCSASNPCPSHLVCHEDVCTLLCHSHTDCPGSHLCTHGVCVQMCTSAENCLSATHLCDSFLCRRSCTITGSTCAPGSTCQPGVGCVTTCSKDEHCLVDLELCVSGLCKPKCKTSSDCDSISTCLNGRCYTVCDKDNEYCSDQQSCVTGLCMSYCKDTADCGTTEVCSVYQANPVCRITCYGNDDCYRQKQVCFVGLCNFPCSAKKDSSCDPGDDCINYNGIEACGPTCSLGCNEVQFCSDKLCLPTYALPCSSDDDCGPYNYCKKKETSISGSCDFSLKVGGSCKANGRCGFNEECVDGICECVKYNDGTCLGAPNYCPDGPTADWITCDVDVAGSLCNEVSGRCECPDNQMQVTLIARQLRNVMKLVSAKISATQRKTVDHLTTALRGCALPAVPGTPIAWVLSAASSASALLPVL
ncbi:hypothetical protein EB796_016987 [Bugula neritina]|uniref:Uncharacterized protein n=1 Tax=Bugula neritina TaxID=10212 RepID=A0A7J7JGF3_BUGNE|nr:hypothetical protein EB796_016987 [Bugula neritina]